MNNLQEKQIIVLHGYIMDVKYGGKPVVIRSRGVDMDSEFMYLEKIKVMDGIIE